MSLIFSSGMRLSPARLNALLPVEAAKISDTSRASTATLAADPELTITGLVANAVYQLEGQLIAKSGTNNTGDIQYGWSVPLGSVLTWAGTGPHNTLGSGGGSSSGADGEWIARLAGDTTAIPYGASTVPTWTLVRGRLVTGATGGDLILRWSQQTSNAAATTLMAGSWIQTRRVS